MRRMWLSAVALVVLALTAAAEAHGQPGCGRFGFAHRGFAWGSGRLLTGGFCGPRFGLCGGVRPWCGWRSAFSGWPTACWNGPVCGPHFGWGASIGWGWPGCGFGGWYGTGFAYGVESVFLAAPVGGASFFSGSVVPFPVPVWAPGRVWYPAPGPLWFGAAPRPAAAVARVPPQPAFRGQPAVAIAARPRPHPPTVAVTARRRAARLAAEGDRQFLASGGARPGLTAAAASYRRAAAAAADDPDLHIREAVVLALLGRNAAAEAACGRAVAVDGRLASREPGQVPPVVARGERILQQLAVGLGAEDARGHAALAAAREHWTGKVVAPALALASRGADR